MSEVMFGYLKTLYDALDAQAENINGKRVFQGSIVKVYRELKISFTHYTSLWDTLYDSGCIELTSRGGRGIPTTLVLLRPPTEDDWNAEEIGRKDLTRGRKYDTLAQRVENIERRLGGTDIGRALADVEKRLQKLEGKGGNKR